MRTREGYHWPRSAWRPTHAQRRILDGVVAGESNTVLAARLGLSPETVKSHVATLLGEASCTDRSELAAWWTAEQTRTGRGVRALPFFLALAALTGAGVAIVGAALVLALAPGGGRARGPGVQPVTATATPPPPATPTSIPVAVVQQFFDAVNRQDQAGAAALLSTTPVTRVYDQNGYPVGACHPVGCEPQDIATLPLLFQQGNLGAADNLALAMTLEQVSPTQVIARGQGKIKRSQKPDIQTYYEVHFEMSGDRIQSYVLNDGTGGLTDPLCGGLPRPPLICPGWAPYQAPAVRTATAPPKPKH